MGILFSENTDPYTGRTQVVVKQVLPSSMLHTPDSVSLCAQSSHLAHCNVLTMNHDHDACIVQVYPGGPAQLAGKIKEGDMLTDVGALAMIHHAQTHT